MCGRTQGGYDNHSMSMFQVSLTDTFVSSRVQSKSSTARATVDGVNCGVTRYALVIAKSVVNVTVDAEVDRRTIVYDKVNIF